MSESPFMSVKTIGLSKVGGRKPQSLLVALRHVRRGNGAEIGFAPHIDPTRSHLNVVLAGAGVADDVVARAHNVMRAVGADPATLRRDHVQAVELVFSLHPDTAVDTEPSFRACHRWLALAFADAPVLAFDVHLDESTPHAHAFILPVSRGRYVGGALNTRPELKKLHASFFLNVAGRYGFRRPHAKLFGQIKLKAVRAVLAELERRQAPELKGALWPLTYQAIQDNPGPYLDALHIDRTNLKPNTIGIEMTATTTTKTHHDVIAAHLAEVQSLPCVRVCSKKAVSEGQYVRFAAPRRNAFTDLLGGAVKPQHDANFQRMMAELVATAEAATVGV